MVHSGASVILWIHPAPFLSKGAALFVPGIGNEEWIKAVQLG